jgi:hypothetical protein
LNWPRKKAHGLTFTAHIHSSCGQTNLSFGHYNLVAATILIISHISTGFASSIGVPSTGTKAFIGTDSGCGFNEPHEHSCSVFNTFSHPYNSATTNRNIRFANIFDCL